MSAFNTVVQPKANKGAIKQNNSKKRKWDRSAERAPKQSKKMAKDDENYIGYVSRDHHAEAGYSLMSGFEAAASGAVLDLAGDDDAAARAKKNVMR